MIEKDRMLLWECKYNLISDIAGDLWVSYIWSTTQPGAADIQHHWDCIFRNNYKVQNFECYAIVPDGRRLENHILEVINF